ncbi:hypothetical protein [Pedobacter jamesrossensis]|uniref:hypothetical protein n=1 Tax=Pedobacter jamesrossensis TaxID=1908238 RepID=UPI0036085962
MGDALTKSGDFPELAEFLDYTRGQNDKLDGLKDGRQQFLEEKLQEKTNEQSKDSNYPSWLKVDRFENLNKGVCKINCVKSKVMLLKKNLVQI